ncbi:small ribosomal subunit protein bS21c-like [Aristolochia californica]|uniref:small ribosomal subunit protein bS21c-like n=1 Tax=Aristolochia californica TaxID=171875 RepID=UPI0035DE84AD
MASLICKFLPLQPLSAKSSQTLPSFPLSPSSLTLFSPSTPGKNGKLSVTRKGESSSYDYLSVAHPSAAYANTLFLRAGYNVQVVVEDNEPEEKLLGRFRREVMKVGVIQECKRRKFFENKQEEKKRKTREAAKREAMRRRRRRPQNRSPVSFKPEDSKSKKDDEEEDNWELPEGKPPF